jgi:glycosyltransferase involved in cell wall biosynthesis
MRSAVITNIEFGNWVLGGIARDIAAKGSFRLVTIDFRKIKSLILTLRTILMSQYLVFVNQDTYFRVCRFGDWIFANKHVRILYTHTISSISKEWRYLQGVDIVCLNSLEKKKLISEGIDQARVSICPIGVDFNGFTPPLKKRKSNKVLLVSDYKLRKNPELLLEVVRHNQDFDFTLIGRRWEMSEIWPNLQPLRNFRYFEFTSQVYKVVLEQNHIFLSLSTLEGGPLPMLETMACNLIPICTPTGWAQDVIKHGKNGFILSEGYKHFDVRHLLERARLLDLAPRESILEFTYDRFLRNFAF